MTEEPVTLLNNYRLGYLLSKNVNIPNYQRGYCWEDSQIKPLLQSLWSAKLDCPYHLGTIIVHDHDEIWDIVDGQQRLITLSILKYCLSNNPPPTSLESHEKSNIEDCKKIPSLLRCKTTDRDMLCHVHEAAKTIKEWINYHQVRNREKLIDFIFGKQTPKYGVCVTVVKIYDQKGQNQNLPLAWTFFNALNSGGKALSDYDLLKAHHLRHLAQNSDDLTIQFKASRWDFLGEQQIISLFGHKNMLYDASFAQTFYLIRTWLRNRRIDISHEPADGRYCILNHYSALTALTTGAEGMTRKITSGIAGGMPFFDWIEYWMWQYRQFCENPIIDKFLNVPWKPQQMHLLIIAKAVMFYYFCRFGGVYLADACIFILYRIGKLRNTRQRLNAWYGNDEKYVQRTMEALDESPTPEHFFYYCQMPSNRYAPRYNLRETYYEMSDQVKEKLLKGWNHGPDWWKRFLALAASSVDKTLSDLHLRDGGIGGTVCFKKDVARLLNEVAKDFGWEYDEKTLTLCEINHLANGEKIENA